MLILIRILIERVIFMKILILLKKINTKILNLMVTGIRISFCLCILATFILITYQLNNFPNLYYIGISLLQSGLFFIVTFIICGFAFNETIGDGD